MKYGLMTDIHFGVKKNSKIILDWQMKAFNKSLRLFRENKVESIIILGDVFDNRNTNTTYIIDTFLNDFLNPLRKYFKDIYIIVGNHDMFYKNKRECNILSAILKERFDNVHVIDNILRIDNLLLVPWICKESDIKTLVEEKASGGILLGHLEVNGFRMVANGKCCDHGLSPSIFKDFELVISGHFHLREKIGNIQYLGTMLGLSWAEYHGDHGVHILDSDSGNLDFFDLNINMHDVLKFENKIYSLEDLERYRNKIVKIIVDDSEDGLFENLVSQISNICFSYCKQYRSTNQNGHENIDDSEESSDNSIEIETDEELMESFISDSLPEHIDQVVFKKLYQRVKDNTEKNMEITR
jgi:DNA repair exonuclease SbcCD nuclease subunit